MPKFKTPNIGEYNRQLVWETYNGAQARDSYNQPKRSGPSPWVNPVTFWGSITPATGKESVNAERVKAAVTHVVECLIPGPIKPKDRLTFVDGVTGSTRYFNIAYVQNVGELNFTFMLYCTEVLNPAEITT